MTTCLASNKNKCPYCQEVITWNEDERAYESAEHGLECPKSKKSNGGYSVYR